MTEYHDLRFMYCASMEWDAATASSWLASYSPPPEALKQIAEDSAAELARREAPCDVHAAARVTSSSAEGFFTIHHPTNQALLEVVRGIHDALGLPYTSSDVDSELLGHLRTPLEPSVIEALGLDLSPDENWKIHGKPYSIDDLVSIHLDWYRQNPSLLHTGVADYAERLAMLDMHPG